MSIFLDKEEVLNELKVKKILKSKEELLNELNFIYKITKTVFNFLNNSEITGFERNIQIGTGSEGSGITGGQGTNPLLWELGHISSFYEIHCFKYLYKDYKVKINNINIYDSFITDRQSRFEFREHSKELLFEYYEYTNYLLNQYIMSKELDEISTYLILLVILHNHMHTESILFSTKLLGYKNPFYKKIENISNEIVDINWIEIPGGEFYQGTYEGENNISFDNEMPKFKVVIKPFLVSNIVVTEKILIKFILDGGYKNDNLWCTNGNRWRSRNKIILPMYWMYNDNEFSIKDYDKIRRPMLNYPACHLNWYEAKAICKWIGGRLPTESEWEYLSTNGGITKFPWGNEWKENTANLDYSGSIKDVNLFSEGDNKWGVRQLFGNVWEWCREPIYPYNGYKINPVYREFSYPFFGFKKILRGGSWAVPKLLINSRYRNAQMPDMRMQFTGVRIVKN